jgi:hypothetical protein
VIVFSTTPLAEAPSSLQALVAQQRDSEPEIIVVYGADADLPERVIRGYPDVVFTRLERGASIARMLGHALARGRGEVLAITEATCEVDQGWVAAIEKAHEGRHPVIGGAVEPERLRTALDWAAFFAEYGHFMPPVTEGVADQVPGINLSIKRSALWRARELVEGEFWKAFWCRRLQAEGTALWLTPSMLVHYRKSFAWWPFLVRRFHHGRCFAAMRVHGIPPWARAVYIAGSPVLPVLFCARIIRSLAVKRRYRWQLIRAFPHLVLATVSWAIGELCGYVLGPGGSCREVR